MTRPYVQKPTQHSPLASSHVQTSRSFKRSPMSLQSGWTLLHCLGPLSVVLVSPKFLAGVPRTNCCGYWCISLHSIVRCPLPKAPFILKHCISSFALLSTTSEYDQHHSLQRTKPIVLMTRMSRLLGKPTLCQHTYYINWNSWSMRMVSVSFSADSHRKYLFPSRRKSLLTDPALLHHLPVCQKMRAFWLDTLCFYSGVSLPKRMI